MHLAFLRHRNCTTCANSNYIPVHLCALQSCCLCFVYQCTRIDYSIKLIHLKIHWGKLYNIILLLTYFKVHRFSQFYNSVLKKIWHAGENSAVSPAPSRHRVCAYVRMCALTALRPKSRRSAKSPPPKTFRFYRYMLLAVDKSLILFTRCYCKVEIKFNIYKESISHNARTF